MARKFLNLHFTVRVTTCLITSHYNKMSDEELRTHFFILRIFGMWTPNFNWIITYGIYYLWRSLIFLLMMTLFISEIVDLYMNKSVEGMTRNLILSTIMVCTMLKLVVLLLKRREIIEMLDLLKLPFCRPITVAENKIINEYRRHARLAITGYLLLCFITLVLQISFPLFTEHGIKERSLPYGTWQPYSIEAIVPYALTYFYLYLCTLVTMPLNVAMDSLISGLMIVTCSHLDLLKSRLARLYTLADLKICVQHHNVIFRFADRVEEIFGLVVFVQFLLSMINICSIIFVIFKSESKAGTIASLFFLASMMVQLLLYCWNGNEVFLKSQSVIRASMDNNNLITLPIKIKKAVLLIMARSQKPVEMKAGLLTLSLDTFMMIVKTSYSAFNLLRNASNK